MHEANRILDGKVEYSDEMYEALNDADGLLIITEWPEFRVLNFKELNARLKTKVLFDGRNIFDYREVKKEGFDYHCIGVRTN
jgi:UDPglucose 6-dehydrogenase